MLIGADGRIEWIGPAAECRVPSAERRVPSAEPLDLGDAILLPGLVNVHTHLELTGFPESADAGSGFAAWIRDIRTRKEGRTRQEYREAARDGLRECWAGGVTTIAETGDSGAVLEALAELGGSGIVYQEVFGPHPSQLEESFAGLRRQVDGLRKCANERVRVGVSPHAPYTVSGPLFARVAGWARSERLPLAVHLAESRAEVEFVTRGTGAFAEAWKDRGIPPLSDPAHQPPSRPAPSAERRVPSAESRAPSPVSWLHSLGVLGPATLCIHAVQVNDGDVELLRDTGSAVAHCPVSNQRHGHGQAPLGSLRRAGVRVGLGTDSVASVGELDLFREMRAARDLAGLSDEEALSLATIEGARSLGLDREIGTLTPGKWADVIAVRPPAVRPSGRLATAVVSSFPADVILTILGGRVVHRA
ncbi:MAG: amidohydrolase family protein [Gemmatimonadales bacterium]